MKNSWRASRPARERRKDANPDELKHLVLAVESMGKRGVAEAAKRQTGFSSFFAVEFNLGFAAGALVSESEAGLRS
jgi:hypothetical protein